MSRRQRRLIAALVVLASGTTLAACGGSSKPSYCSSLANLESSIKALPNANVVKNGTSALEKALDQVKTNAQNVQSDAKNDFPTESAALKSSVDALSATVKQLTTSPTPAAIAQLPGQATAVANAVQAFSNATSSKCS